MVKDSNTNLRLHDIWTKVSPEGLKYSWVSYGEKNKYVMNSLRYESKLISLLRIYDHSMKRYK